MTSAVNSPCWRTMSASQSSNSVRSEVNNGHLWEILVEQRIERGAAVRALEPALESLQLRHHGRRPAVLLRAEAACHRRAHGLQLGQDRIVRLAGAGPADFLAYGLALGRPRLLGLALGRVGMARENAHQARAAEGEGALPLEALDLLGH